MATKKKSKKKSNVSNTKLAYLAGILDAKCTISCAIKKFRRKGLVTFNFTGSDEEFVDFIKTSILKTGKIRKDVIYAKQKCDQLVIGGDKVLSILKSLHPFLVIRKKQVGSIIKLLRVVEDSEFDISEDNIALGAKLVRSIKRQGEKPLIRPNIIIRESRHSSAAEKYKMTPQIKALYESEKKLGGLRQPVLEKSCMRFLSNNSNPYSKFINVKIFKLKGEDIMLTDTLPYCKECYQWKKCTRLCSFSIRQTRALFKRFETAYFCCFEANLDAIGKHFYDVNKAKGKEVKRFPGVWYYKKGSVMSPLFLLNHCRQPINQVFIKLLTAKLASVGSLVLSPGFINKPNQTLAERMNVNVFGMYKRLGISFEFPVMHKIVFSGIILTYKPKS